MLKLSIITVNKNDSKGLEKTIASVRNQSFTDYEFIIIDGASNDESVQVIKDNLDIISYWVSEADAGIYNAMNKGIKRAKGRYSLFLNSGDWLVEDVLKDVEPYFSKDIDVLYGNYYGIADQTVDTKILRLMPKQVDFYFFFTGSLGHQSSFIKTERLKKNPYKDNYTIVSDWGWMVEALLADALFTHVDFCISYFNFDGISSNMNEKHIQERKFYLKECIHPNIVDALYTFDYKMHSGICYYSKILEKHRFLEKILILILRLFRKIDYLFRKK